MRTMNRNLAWAMVKSHLPVIYETHGIGFYCPDQTSMWRADTFATKEPETLKWIDEQVFPGAVLTDIGASGGIYGIYAAQKGADVWAYEPDLKTFRILIENVGINNIVMHPHNLAVGNGHRIQMNPDLVKIDTDGMELEILTSNENRIRKARSIMIEEFPADKSEIDEIITGWGFTCQGRYISEMMKNAGWNYRNVVWVK